MRQPRYADIFAGHDDGAQMAENARVIWAEYKSGLEARGLWNAARARTLDRLVRSVVEYEQLYPIAIAEGAVKVGPNGGDVFNFRWSALMKLGEQVSKLETALTLTPMSVGAKPDDGAKMQPPSSASKYLDRSKAH